MNIQPVVYNFFVKDAQLLAPEGIELPPNEDIIDAHLWDDLIIDLDRDGIRYTSMSHQLLTYWVPFFPTSKEHCRLENVAERFETLVCWGCVARVRWNIHTLPGKDTDDLTFSCFKALRGVDNIFVDISQQALLWGVKLIGHLSPMARLDSLTLKVRKGDFSSPGPAIDILTPLIEQDLECWAQWLDLHVEVDKIADFGRAVLEKAASLIKVVSFDVLNNRSVLDQVCLFLRHSCSRIEINIAKWDLPGEVRVHLDTRGNLSLSIGVISSESILLLESYKEIRHLTIGKVLGHISGPKLPLYELRVTNQFCDAAIMELKSYFSRVSRVSRVEKDPQLGTLEVTPLSWL